ncbi:hypothetical protein [Mycoplasma seminis]|uniref:Transposase n=1 Tax=Mycoplasma seminis TaxID=512749 RepID=A0ABY9HAZ5_9MOLU|nr:hypothetical protein [Mycoplasma seminis]WLP85646.1 hypothetical protein Q8852_00595 [Mycoplasma seminis]
MLSNAKHYQNNLICLKFRAKSRNSKYSTEFTTRYSHYVLRPYLDKSKLKMLNTKIQNIKQYSPREFTIEKMKDLFNKLKDEWSLLEISRQMSCDIKTIREQIEKASEEYKVQTSLFCKICKRHVGAFSYLSINEWTKSKIYTRENTLDGKRITSLEKWKPLHEFTQDWISKHKEYRSLTTAEKKRLTSEQLVYYRKTSLQKILDKFEDYVKENNLQNVFIPTVQGFYEYIDRYYVDFEYKILTLKRKYGIAKSRLKKPKKAKIKSKLKFAKSVHERSEKINIREEFGHYEIDTVQFKKTSKYCLVTLLERKTRMLFAMYSKRDAVSVRFSAWKADMQI